ncbi:MAG: cation:proton antiporter [Candidatus Sulfobium sp.]|jgi:CPA2 family monovalent cation:H+ antiporter-2
MEHEFLGSLVIILGVSAVVVFLLHRLRIPSVAGFLIAGTIVGPGGIRLVSDVYAVEVLAEAGVILLLFTIGIEFSISRLLRMKKEVIAGGGAQVLLTIAVSAGIAFLATGAPKKSVFFGFLVALSSTAIVLKMLVDRGETDSPQGRLMTGTLIFQDLCAVFFMLLIPALSGVGIRTADIAEQVAVAVFIIAVVLLSARWIVPGLLHQVVHTRSRELFIVTIIFLCFGIALVTSLAGLSLALGAFIAGLVISDSEYSHQATSDVLPFKDSFMGLFFVSVGMLMDVGYIADHFLLVAAAVTLFYCLKIVTGTVSGLAAGFPLRASVHSGLGLAQIGEFSFVLAVAGKSAGIVTEDFYQVFLSASVLTMIATPFVLGAAPAWSERFVSGLRGRAGGRGRMPDAERFRPGRRGHVIVVGFGLNGRNLSRVLREARIPYVVLEINNDTVREMKKKGEPIYYGDGTSREVLLKLGLEKAKMLVIAISDPASSRRIVSIARHEHPGIHIIVRTRYLSEVDDLMALGADEVIPQEFETSVEIFSRVLRHYQIPGNVIEEYIEAVRMDGYRALRTTDLPPLEFAERFKLLGGVETETYLIREGEKIDGKSVGGLRLRTKTGASVVSVQRGDRIHYNPSPDFVMKAGDVILLIGGKDDIHRAFEFFKSARRLDRERGEMT